MPIKDHLSESLRLNPAPSPWPRMLLCALSVTLPLILGVVNNDHENSIYGALMGFILILNDHFGPLKTRILHLITAFLFIGSGFFLGLFVAGNDWIIYPTLLILAFITGKSKGHGLELERLLLFTTFQFMNAALTPGIEAHVKELFFYATISFVNYLVCLCLVYLLLRHAPNFQKSKRSLIRQAFEKKETQRFAITLALASCFGLFLGTILELARANWIVVTVLVVMMPTKSQSYQRSFQRAFGTIIGVTTSLLVTHFGKDPAVLISFSAIASFFAPLGLIRNYWLGNAFIAALIMFFMQLSHLTEGNSEFVFAWLRLIDIGIGCVIGAVATIIAFPPAKK